MRKLLVSSVLFLLLPIVAACGDTSAAGTYKLDTAALREQMRKQMPPDAPKEATEQFEKMTEAMQGSIELKSDGTASFVFKAPPFADESASGTWKLDGNALTLTTTKDGKQDTETATLSGGTITLRKEESGQTMELVFRK